MRGSRAGGGAWKAGLQGRGRESEQGGSEERGLERE